MKLNLEKKCWPLNQSFNISRGKKTEALTVEVNLTNNGHLGKGECVPYSRYNESVESVCNQLENIVLDIENGTIDNILHGIDDIVINSQNTIIQSVFGINGSELESMVNDENLYMEIDMDLVLGAQNYARKAIENSIVQIIVAIAKSG